MFSEVAEDPKILMAIRWPVCNNVWHNLLPCPTPKRPILGAILDPPLPHLPQYRMSLMDFPLETLPTYIQKPHKT